MFRLKIFIQNNETMLRQTVKKYREWISNNECTIHHHSKKNSILSLFIQQG